MSELPKYVLVRLSYDVGDPTEIKAEYEPNPDVVEVVRCKDCKYYEIYELKSDGTDDRRYKPSVCVKDKYAEHRKPDWFCSAGKRREQP